MIKLQTALLFLYFAAFSIQGQAQKLSYIPFIDNGKWGLIDSTDNIIWSASCDSVYIYPNGDVQLYNGQQIGVWNLAGELIIPFGTASYFSGFIDALMPDVVPAQTAWLRDEKGKLSLLYKDGHTKVLSESYNYTHCFVEHRAVVRKVDKMGVVDSSGKIIIPCQYEAIHPYYKNGRIAVQQNGQWALFDAAGKQLTPFKYTALGRCSFHRISFKNKEFWGFLDKNGKEVVSASYDYASNFYEGLAFCRRADTIGYIDTMGKVIVPFQYFKYGGRFQEGRAYVGNQKRYGIIDVKGNFLIWTSRYITIQNYRAGFAKWAILIGEENLSLLAFLTKLMALQMHN